MAKMATYNRWQKKFGDIETRFFAEAADVADLVRHQDMLRSCSIRAHFGFEVNFKSAAYCHKCNRY